MYKAIIVEDDPMVAEINRTYCNGSDKLRVAAMFSDGKAALEYLLHNQVDLIILDGRLPKLSGTELLRALRAAGHTEDVIMVTAITGAAEIRPILSLGIVDYVMKPYQYERFQTAVNRFLSRRQDLSDGGPCTQKSIDRILGFMPPDDKLSRTNGIQDATLELISAYMDRHSGESLPVNVISSGVKLSPPTVRRYLNYLVFRGRITATIDNSTGGRPSYLYTYST